MSLTRGLVLDVANQVGGAMPSIVTLHDWSRYHNHGAITGATWSQLPSGLWYQDFDGAANLVDHGDKACFNLDNYSILCWFKTSETTTRIVIDNYDAGTGGYSFTIFAPGYIRNSCVNSAGVGDNQDDNVLVVDDVWHHCACIYDGARKYIYRDGIEAANAVYVQTLGYSAFKFYLGERNELEPSALNYLGSLVLTNVYNYGLTSAQIRATFHSQKWLFGVAS